ncbi:MAG: hypothetical protein KME25_31475 [Symplocastrum torsivum CPER-KK1]|uniref:Uncharacterized protein n=1 Tax=Symplocastrum torsivum CPER-KK1 TaxID=450513 RepID=A0A951PRG3_9CYAN|nr:hypothetical protein [Symplocastrum torsivum CPER-KK1]
MTKSTKYVICGNPTQVDPRGRWRCDHLLADLPLKLTAMSEFRELDAIAI